MERCTKLVVDQSTDEVSIVEDKERGSAIDVTREDQQKILRESD